ncbi:unnamed protein product, partial [Lymnaea stagnalis]
MDARRRRRLLERSSDISSEDSASWRSKIYQSETTVTSPMDHRRDRRESRNSQDASCKEDLESRTRRVKVEESGNSELAERLARRRAQRLEEQGDSSSLDGSLDSRQRDRRWSRDGSVRSVDSAENGETEDRVYSRRNRRIDGENISRNNNSSNETFNWRRSSRDSNVSEEGNDIFEELKCERNTKRWSRTKESEASVSDDKDNQMSSDFRSRQLSSVDSNFKSADSGSGLNTSYDAEGGHYNGSEKSRLHLDHDDSNASNEDNRYKRKQFQELSSDSAFSEPMDKNDDFIANINNNNNSSKSKSFLKEDVTLSPSTFRRLRIQDFIDECEEAHDSLSADKNGVEKDNKATNGLEKISAATAEATDSTIFASPTRWRTHVPLSASASLDTGLRTCSRSEANDSLANGENGEGVVDVVASFKARLLRQRGVITEGTGGLSLQDSEIRPKPPDTALQCSCGPKVKAAVSGNSNPSVNVTDTPAQVTPLQDKLNIDTTTTVVNTPVVEDTL